MAEYVTIGTPSVPCFITNPGANVTTATTVVAPTSVAGNTFPGGQFAARPNDGILPLGHQGSSTVSGIKLFPYGFGTNGSTFTLAVFGWESVGPIPSDSTQPTKGFWWIAPMMASFTCTLDSAFPGPGGNTDVGTTAFFCSTIALVTGNSGISVEVISPGAGNGQAQILLSTKGPRYADVRFATGAGVTSCNCLGRRA